jgi:hypothetical protein
MLASSAKTWIEDFVAGKFLTVVSETGLQSGRAGFEKTCVHN